LLDSYGAMLLILVWSSPTIILSRLMTKEITKCGSPNSCLGALSKALKKSIKQQYLFACFRFLNGGCNLSLLSMHENDMICLENFSFGLHYIFTNLPNLYDLFGAI
jgi:hypothetical protein